MPFSISEWVSNYLNERPYIKTSLKEDIVNYSSLARNIAPDIEKEMGKPVNVDSIMVAIRRYSEKNNFSAKEPQMQEHLKRTTLALQDGVSFAMVQNDEEVEKNLYRAIEQEQWGSTEFRVILGSPSHILVVLRSNKMKRVLEKLSTAHILRSEEGFSIVTLKPPIESFKTAGFINEVSTELAKLEITHMLLAVPPEIHFIVSGKNSTSAYTVFKRMLGQTEENAPASDLL